MKATKTKARPIEDYIRRIEDCLLAQHPDMSFQVLRPRKKEAFVYYSLPQPLEDTYDLTLIASGIGLDALIDDGYSVLAFQREDWLMPDGTLLMPPLDD